MDFADIKRKAQAAREFSVQVGGLGFTLRLPTQHEVEVQAARVRLHEDDADPAMLLRLRRSLVEHAVVAWAGVTLEHLAPGGGSDAAEVSQQAVALFLDANEAAADALYGEFVARRAERLQRQGDAAKN